MTKTQKLFGAVTIAIAAIGAGACFDKFVVAPSQTQDQNHNNTNVAPTPAPSASPSPKAGGNGSVVSDTVAISVNGFDHGEVCDAPAKPANANGAIGVGCKLAVSCNPRNAHGDVIHDSNPPRAVLTLKTGSDVVTFSARNDESNGYNGDVTALKVGIFTLKCEIPDIAKSGESSFAVVVPSN